MPELLSDTHHVVAYDLRGHGQSGDAKTGDYSMTAHARDLDAVLAAVVADGMPAVVVGNSLGGGIILARAAECGNGGVAGVVFAGSGGSGVTFPGFPAQDVPRWAQVRLRWAWLKVLRITALVGRRLRPVQAISNRLVRRYAFTSSAPRELVDQVREEFLSSRPRALAGTTLASVSHDGPRLAPSLDVPTLGADPMMVSVPGYPARSLMDDHSLQKIASQVELSYSYLVYMSAAGVLASVALLSNSIPILIGSMIVAPLMPPLALIPFGLVQRRRAQAARGLQVALVGLLLAFTATWATTALMDAFGVMAPEAVLLDTPLLQERVHPGWWSMAAAVAAGLAGTLAQAHEKTDALIGTVASLALVPAVGASAVALYLGAPAAALGGLLLLGINIGLIIAMGVTAVLLPTGRSGLGRPLALLPVATLVVAALLLLWAQASGTVPETPANSHPTSSAAHTGTSSTTDVG